MFYFNSSISWKEDTKELFSSASSDTEDSNFYDSEMFLSSFNYSSIRKKLDFLLVLGDLGLATLVFNLFNIGF